MNNTTSSQLSSSSSETSDKRGDPDFYRRPVRVSPRLQPKRTLKKKERGVNIEAGSSSSTRRLRRPRNETPIFGVRRRKITNQHARTWIVSRPTLMSWLLKMNIIKENDKVFGENESSGGHVRNGGIVCVCCGIIYSPTGFATHKMCEAFISPFENIFVEGTRITLLALLENALEKEIVPVEPTIESHDDICNFCADGGSLICCKTCTSVCHQDCAGLEVVPQEDWFCSYCKCKFCWSSCRDKVAKCFQCKKQYHWESCCQMTPPFVNSWGLGVPLCDDNCREVYMKLRRVVGVQHELSEGFSWTLIRRMDEVAVLGLKNYQIIECHAKLALARDIMRESFEPVIDRLTGIDMIQNVMYNRGSNCRRIDFRGFYTVILEKDDEIVSVASLRIHGTKFAELPFVVTSEKHRGRGNCRRLLSAIESALCSLEVQNLVLPSTIERSISWGKIGFQVPDPAITQELMEWNTLTFHDSVMLHKRLPANNQGSCDTTRGRYETGERSRRISSTLRFDLNGDPPEDELMKLTRRLRQG